MLCIEAQPPTVFENIEEASGHVSPKIKVHSAACSSGHTASLATTSKRLLFANDDTNATEQSTDLNHLALVTFEGASLMKGEDEETEKVARANADIDKLIDSDVLHSLNYISPNKDLGISQSPILRPKMQVQLDQGKQKVDDIVHEAANVKEIPLAERFPTFSKMSESEVLFWAQVPSPEVLENLLETSRMWTKFETKLPESTTKDGEPDKSPAKRGHTNDSLNNVAITAHKLLHTADAMSDFLKQLTEVTANCKVMLPHFAEGAVSFYNFTKFLKPLLHELQRAEKEYAEARVVEATNRGL